MVFFVCKVTSGKKSAQYGVRFSYPLYISLVTIGITMMNPYILSLTALIAFFGVILPMHPFDYIYNYGVANLIGSKKIPGRGSEAQVSSMVALVFNLAVIGSLAFGNQLNYIIMALIYAVINLFFITIQLFTDNFSIFTIKSFFKKSN